MLSVATRTRGGDVETLLGWIFVEPFWAGSDRLEKESRACLDDRIMLSKAMGGVYYQRSLPDRCSEVIAIPSWKGCI